MHPCFSRGHKTFGWQNFRSEKNWITKYFQDVEDFKVLTIPTTDRGLHVDAEEVAQRVKDVSEKQFWYFHDYVLIIVLARKGKLVPYV